MNELEIFINGVRIQTLATHLQALLLERGHALDGAFACAINNTFIPRARWPRQLLLAHDRVDVIAPITGG